MPGGHLEPHEPVPGAGCCGAGAGVALWGRPGLAAARGPQDMPGWSPLPRYNCSVYSSPFPR